MNRIKKSVQSMSRKLEKSAKELESTITYEKLRDLWESLKIHKSMKKDKKYKKY